MGTVTEKDMITKTRKETKRVVSTGRSPCKRLRWAPVQFPLLLKGGNFYFGLTYSFNSVDNF